MELPSILAALQQQRNLLDSAVESLQKLAQLQGENPIHTISLRGSGNGHNGHRRKTQRRKIGQRASGKRGPKVGEGTTGRKIPRRADGDTLPAQIVKLLRKHKQPVTYPDLLDRLLANGWQTTSSDPKNVVQAAIYQMRKQREVKRFGEKGNYLIGLPEWSAAAAAGELYAASQR